jgi:riboflavin kinase/FMN adenylyltransferase
VEVHLLDRRLELVGEELVVEPLQLLRRQQAFASFAELSAQIALDADRARALPPGVGMGEPPANEAGDPAEQQNP